MYAEIAIDVPLKTLFTYKIPEALRANVHRGCRVLVSFHRKNVVGLCLALNQSHDPQTSGVNAINLKEILAADASLALSETYLRWLEFAANYYVCPPGQVFSQAIPPAYFNSKDFAFEKKYRAKNTYIGDFPTENKTLSLTSEQQDIIAAIGARFGEYTPALLRGVTGSGKTEVYIELIKKALANGRSALYLVPEIGLTPQTLARLANHFAEELLIYHSGLSANQRLLAWQKTLAGKPCVLVGTRSALFAPLANLGLIVVDEEHDSSYKQEDRFRYHARDLAVMRAHLENIPVILGSATPSLESYHHARQGKYAYLELPSRIGGLAMPHVEIIDIAREKEQTKLPLNLSQHVTQAVQSHLQNGEQVILFVGQRGYAQNAFCRDCQKIQTCRNCSVGLKFHATANILKCHYCDLKKKFDEICTSCGKKTLTLLGMGIQSVEEEIRIGFPKARIVRVDSDTFPSPQKLGRILEEFAAGKIDVILGTQMMSKGHDFGNVGFVGIVGIDAHLGLPDFRAAERSFQTLVQVAGRAGRKGRQGRVLVQSYYPAHKSLVYGVEHDYNGFAAYELAARESLNYPPFSRIAQLRMISNDEGELQSMLRSRAADIVRIKEQLAKSGIQILGPAEMPIYKLRGKYRYHMILKMPRKIKNRDVVSYVLQEFERHPPGKIQFQVDIDPVSLL